MANPNKLIDAKILLRSAFLEEAKRFSLISQKKDINVIRMLNAVETTKANYQSLLAKLKTHPQFIFKLPNLKLFRCDQFVCGRGASVSKT